MVRNGLLLRGAKSTLYFTLWLFSQLGRACCFLPRQVWQALYVYLLEYQSGKRVSHKRVLELSYEDVKSDKMDWLSLHRILIILLQNLLRQMNIQNIWQKRQFWKGLQKERRGCHGIVDLMIPWHPLLEGKLDLWHYRFHNLFLIFRYSLGEYPFSLWKSRLK